MKSWLCCIGLVAVAVLTGTACGDDSSTGSGGAGGTGGAGGSGGSGGSGGAFCPDAGGGSKTSICVTVHDNEKLEYTGTAAPVYTCDANKSTTCLDSKNACRNASDCAMIATNLVRGIVRECALSYRDKEPMPGVPEEERIAACQTVADLNTACVKGATAMKIMQPGISDECGKCYTEIALCSSALCLSQCIANADAIECIKCQFAEGCRVPFEKCSGLDRQ